MADPCDKVRFPSRRKARKAARVISESGQPMRAYRCTRCQKWHLTSNVDGAPPSAMPSHAPHRRRPPVRSVEELEARAAEIRAGRDPAPHKED